MSNDTLIFVDIETSGLSLQKDVVMEVAALPVDADLNPIDEGLSVVVWNHADDLDLDPFVQEMHTGNGLLAAVDKGMWIKEAEMILVDYVSHYGDRNQIPMAGSTIRFDRNFLERDMPKLEQWFHYRCVDVSTVKELFRRWFPGFGEPPKVKAHRALPDCYESVAELAWYKERIAMSARFLTEFVQADM